MLMLWCFRVKLTGAIERPPKPPIVVTLTSKWLKKLEHVIQSHSNTWLCAVHLDPHLTTYHWDVGDKWDKSPNKTHPPYKLWNLVGWSDVWAWEQLAMATPRGTGYGAALSQKLREESKSTKSNWTYNQNLSENIWNLPVGVSWRAWCVGPLCTCGIETAAAMEREGGFVLDKLWG